MKIVNALKYLHIHFFNSPPKWPFILMQKSVYVIGFAKTHLIAGVRNSSYSPFSSAKYCFVDLLFSSKIQNMTFMLYVHTIIIVGELYKGSE